MSEEDVVRRHGYHHLRVKRVVSETADASSFAFEVPAEFADLYRYDAGQFLTFRVEVGGEELIRCYSMSSSPVTDPDITVTVKRVPDGRVSNWFNDHVKEGDTLDVMKPSGVFCIKTDDRPVVGFCGGSGVTPVISIAKTLLASSARPVHVLYANRDAESVIFADQWRQLEAEHGDRLRLVHHLDSSSGYLTADAVREFVGGTTDADFYICGPGPFMDLVESSLHEMAVPDDRISIERFVNAGETVDLPPAPEEAGAVVPDEITLVVKRRKHVLKYRAGDTVLATARAGGVATPFSCEAGVCASCMAMVRGGTVAMRLNGALTPEEVAEGWVLTCQSVPTSDGVVLDFEPL